MVGRNLRPLQLRAFLIGFAFVAAVLVSESPLRSAAGEPTEVTACSKQVTKQALRKFVRAYNQGDSERLDRLFDDEPGFQWYSIGPPGSRYGVRARRRSSLIAYFSARHSLRDRLHLRGFGPIGKGHGGPEYEHASHFSLHMSRRADGFNGGRWFRLGGKGALVCVGTQPRFIVLSIGGPLWMAPGVS